MPKTKKQTTKRSLPKLNRKIASILIVVALAIIGVLVLGFGKAATVDNFVDISSPQCGNNSIIGSRNYYGIVGLNGTYINFGTNPCVAEQTRLFTAYDLYVGANYPSGPCAGMSPFDCGKKAAAHNMNLIRFFNLKPLRIWIDVETGPNIKWSTNKNDNNAFLLGLYSGMGGNSTIIGYYSNQNMWNEITGGANLGGGGNWYATGQTNGIAALGYCSKQFGGVSNKYVQYVENGRLDVNMDCLANSKSPTPAPAPAPAPTPSK